MLSAFIGSVLNGLLSGAFIAFVTGWIAWLASARIVVAALYEFHLAYKAGTNFQAVLDRDAYAGLGMSELNMNTAAPASGSALDAPPPAYDAQHSQVDLLGGNTSYPPQRPYNNAGLPPIVLPQNLFKRIRAGFLLLSNKISPPVRTVSVFGWLGWVWSALYTPLSHSIWLAANIASQQKGGILIVRALAIAVSALGLTFDTKMRYGAALGRKWGKWAFVVFNVWNAGACLVLGLEAVALLIVGALRVEFLPGFAVAAYVVFSFVWAGASWLFLPPTDAARGGKATVLGVIVGVAVGAFAGIFVAAPAFTLWRDNLFEERKGSMFGESSTQSSGVELGEYLSCAGVSVWEKFAAVMP